MKLLKVIAKAGCDDVLLALSENEELNFGAIAKLMKHRPTATRALKELTKAGLLERKVLEDRSVRYRLTGKGKAVSKIVKELREIEADFE
jgi:DNA-binding HxlR family transcriptional regulator